MSPQVCYNKAMMSRYEELLRQLDYTLVLKYRYRRNKSNKDSKILRAIDRTARQITRELIAEEDKILNGKG